MNRLLNKTLLYYIASAVVLLILSAPAYYLLTRKIYLEDLDEAILLRKEEFHAGALNTLKKSEVPDWNRFSRDVRILPDTVTRPMEAIIRQEFYDPVSGEWEPYRVLYTRVRIEGAPFVLMIRLNLVESEDLVTNTAVLFLIILAILLAGFVIVSRIISDRLWKPFHHALALIENFNLEKHGIPRFPETNILEFRQLNNALEKLIGQNVRAFHTQKEFTENASHELQTPLALMRSKLDLLLQSPGLTREQAGMIQQLYDAVSRLTRINKNLLLLARMEKDQYARKENLSVRDLVRELLSAFREQAIEKQLDVREDLAEDVVVHANRGLAEILISNLIVNAFHHNSLNGEVSVRTGKGRLLVANTGDAGPLQAERLFQRFGRASEQTGGSGLGLAIVKKIADMNRWQVDYSFTGGRHVFAVQFPAAG